MVTKSTAGRSETMSRAWGVKKVFHRACSAAAQAFGFIRVSFCLLVISCVTSSGTE